MKICKVCRKELPENSFYFSGLGKRWRGNICKKCSNKKTLQRRKIKFSRAWFRVKWCGLKRGAKDRNRKFELTFEEFCRIRKNEKCFYCGTTHSPFSIERLDNARGYSISNCVVACWRCNKMKSKDYTAEEMKILGKALRKIDKMRNI